MNELTINYVLKKNRGNERTVVLVASFGYKVVNLIEGKTKYLPLRYSTKVNLTEKEWDKQNKVPLSIEKLSELNRIKTTLESIYKYLVVDGVEITPELLRTELNNKLGRESNREIKTKFAVVFTEFLTNVTEKDQNRAKRTRTSFVTLKNQILNFEKEQGLILSTQNLDEELYLKFVHFVRSNQGRINSVHAILKNLQTTVSDIKRTYKKQNIKVFSPSEELANKDKVKKVDPDKVFMDFDMIEDIINYEPTNETMSNTKLILLTLLFTGCRYSDVFKINPQAYNKKGKKFRYARFSDQKEGGDILVPLLLPLEDAIRKNGGKLPRKISSQKFNSYVKDLVAYVGGEFSEQVEVPFIDSFGKTQYEVKYFYKFVSSHIGRRSFVTNLIDFIPITILSKITGHKLVDKSVIVKYKKRSLLDNACLFLDQLRNIQEVYKDYFPIRLV